MKRKARISPLIIARSRIRLKNAVAQVLCVVALIGGIGENAFAAKKPKPPKPPKITLSVSPVMINEGGTAAYKISASTVNPTTSITVNYSMSGTAALGSDYLLDGTAGQFTLSSGTSTATVNLTALTDNVSPEASKTAIMTLTTGTGYKLVKAKKKAPKPTVTIGDVAPTPTPSPTVPPSPNADAGSSYTNTKTPPHTIDRPALIATIGAPANSDIGPGTARGDFDGDGIADIVLTPSQGSTTNTPVPIIIAKGLPNGSYRDATTEIILGEIPAPIGARKVLIADFNGDGFPDIFIADSGYDLPPFPGHYNWLLLSDGAGHLINQPEMALIDPTGYHHSATAGDIDNDGDIDIFVIGTHDDYGCYFLINDGTGHFSFDQKRCAGAFRTNLLHYTEGMFTIPGFTAEFIDVDKDGYLDLLNGPPEDGQYPELTSPAEILWGDGTGYYVQSRSTALPRDAKWNGALDFAAEDLNGDGLRDLVISRTDIYPTFYTGYYIQIVMQTSPRQFTDESLQRLVGDRDKWMGNDGAFFIDWTHLVDVTGDFARDIVVNDADFHLGWTNDGNGYFMFNAGAPSPAPSPTP